MPQLTVKKKFKKIHGLHCFQRKLPEQDIAQGSYIALPLTLLLLLAGYNHDKVGHVFLSLFKYYFRGISMNSSCTVLREGWL